MILISRVKYIIFNTLIILGMTVFGFIGYIYIVPFNKSSGETFLFVSLIFAITLCVEFYLSVKKSKNVSNEIDKLIHLSSVGGFTPGSSLKRLGKLGDQINHLYYSLNQMNIKRSLKISTQTTLIDFVTTNTLLPLIISDPLGKILYVSKAFIDKKNMLKSECIENTITSILPDLDIQTLIGKLNTTHTYTEYHESKETIEIYPITNKYSDIAYLIFIFGKHTIYFLEKKPEKEQLIHSLLKKITSIDLHHRKG